ncbi:MAG: MopE-related protein, partial [Myxococcota bacterium]|nr:MopE-related protein [Myxococcota bacterium]
IDQNCAGDDDFDADGDSWVPEGAYLNRATWNSPGSASGHSGAGDCWDAPNNAIAEGDNAVVPADVAGTEWAQPLPSQVHPGVPAGDELPGDAGLIDTWYDGVDQDCGGDDDFDADRDGYRTDVWPDATGSIGVDCLDMPEAGDDGTIDWAGAAAVNPDAEEVWYDGIDQDCDTEATADCDRDGDGYRADPNHAADPTLSPCDFAEDEAIDCRDDDATVSPDPSIAEVPYNGTDDNCDASDGDGDKDGDGHWAMDYEAVLASRGLTADETVIPPGTLDDCWDDADVDASAAGTAAGVELRVIDGFDALGPADVYPGAADRPYDGASQDCAAADSDGDGISDDFDWDSDGHSSSAWSERSGAVGGDCIDCPTACTDGTWTGRVEQDWCDALCTGESTNSAGIASELVNPVASETWYDGTDQDCDGASDDDADEDGHDHVGQGGTDCFEGTALDVDANPGGVAASAINPDAAEVWYDGTDQDCDGASDLDADGDGYDSDAFGGADCIEGTSADTASNGAGIDASLVNPGAAETWYDGTDQDCDG